MKPISSDKNTTRPFKVYKAQSYSYTFGMSSTQLSSVIISPDLVKLRSGSAQTFSAVGYDINNTIVPISPKWSVGSSIPSNTVIAGTILPQLGIDIATKPISTGNVWDLNGTELKNQDGILEHSLYRSIKHLFYNSSSFVDGSLKTIFTPSSSLFVINIPRNMMGEGILPGTFKIIQNDKTISDDSNGHLSSGFNVIGNIFYELGIAVINKIDTPVVGSGSILPNGLILQIGNTISINFKSIQTIYEHQIVCTMNPSDFNYTMNPTALTGSINSGERVYSRIATGSMVPYFTTLGLYNDNQELIMVAKLPNPVKRATDTDQSVIIRFDT